MATATIAQPLTKPQVIAASMLIRLSNPSIA
jgi:hypothetical protein